MLSSIVHTIYVFSISVDSFFTLLLYLRIDLFRLCDWFMMIYRNIVQLDSHHVTYCYNNQ